MISPLFAPFAATAPYVPQAGNLITVTWFNGQRIGARFLAVNESSDLYCTIRYIDGPLRGEKATWEIAKISPAI